MRTSLALVVVLAIIVVECATLFIIFVPIVPQTAKEPCYGNATECPQAVLIFNYYGSISFNYFNLGMTYGACGGFQMVPSPMRSPWYCNPTNLAGSS